MKKYFFIICVFLSFNAFAQNIQTTTTQNTGNIYHMGKLGVGITAPISLLHLYENTANTANTAGLTIEQAGSGNSVINFLQTSAYRWVIGIDHANENRLKIGRGVNWALGADITINTGGSVGIGTSAPLSKLNIGGTLGQYSWGIGNGWGDFSISNGTYGLAIGVADGGSGAGLVCIWTKGGNEKLVFGNPTNGAIMTFLNGNVGIGTSNPTRKLEVKDGDLFINDPSNDGGTIRSNGHYMDFKGTNETAYAHRIYRFYPSPGSQGVTYTNIKLYSGATDGSFTEKVNISSSGNTYFNGGNVLIGQTSQVNSAYKLDVNGTIRAKEIKVNTTGADFVFATDYKLRSISEVESFVKENQHLPDIAPAAEMQANGVNVSELQTKLLQKIEELTLYVIEQNKQLASQNAAIAAQQTEIELLKQQVNK